MSKTKLRTGDLVEVRTKDEVLSTLDEQGRLDGLPFMPEMFEFCGKRFRVFKRAHKTCDTVFPVRGRRLNDTVHLETRCDGQAHGGCQAGCLIFWKTDWLKKINEGRENAPTQRTTASSSAVRCTHDAVLRHTRHPGSQQDTTTYICQATQLPYFTSDLNWWDFRQYVEDYTSGNVGLRQVVRGGIYATYYGISQAGIGLGPLLRWLYDRLYSRRRGTMFPRTVGNIPVGAPTPGCKLDLKEGELIRIKSHAEILQTLNTESKNRGMLFDAELVPYCGSERRVLKLVRNIIDERSGKMLTFNTPAIILESVYCLSRYSNNRMFCPRSIYSFWRDVWLERPSDSTAVARNTLKNASH